MFCSIGRAKRYLVKLAVLLITTENNVDTAEEEPSKTADDAESEPEINETGANNATRVAKSGEKIDFLTARFYVPEDLRIRAENRFDPKGSNWRSAILISVITLVAAGVLYTLVPELVQLADNIMTWLAPQNK